MKETIRRLLLDAGLADERTDNLVKLIALEIGRATVPKDEFNAKSEKIRALQEQLGQRDVSITNLQKSAGSADSLSKQLATLQKKYDVDVKNLRENIELLKFNYALDLALISAGSRQTKAVKALLNIEKLNYSEKYGIEGLDDQLKKLKATDGYLFDLPPEKRIHSVHKLNKNISRVKHY
jgi:hypothetical protein